MEGACEEVVVLAGIRFLKCTLESPAQCRWGWGGEEGTNPTASAEVQAFTLSERGSH